MADQRVELWDAINDYVRSCYGDPGSHVHGNTSRQDAVVRIEELWNRRAPDPRLAELVRAAVAVREWLRGAGPIGCQEDLDLIRTVDWLRCHEPDLLEACGAETSSG